MEAQRTVCSHSILEQTSRTKLEVSHALISYYTTKLQSLKQYSTSIKTDI